MDTNDLARHATALLQDPALLEAFRLLREEDTKRWTNTKPDEISVREAAFSDLRAISRLEARLRSLADAPKVNAFNKRGGR